MKIKNKTRLYVLSLVSLSILLSALVLPGPRLYGSDNGSDAVTLEQLRDLVILEQGRKKPLDTYARNLLKQFSGRSTYLKKPALQWLARVLFDPEKARDDKVFLVNTPEVLESMGVAQEGKDRERYSFSHLEPGMLKLRQLAMKISRIESKDQTYVEREIMMLYNRLYLYQQLVLSFEMFFPAPELKISAKDTAQILGLPADTTQLTPFEAMKLRGKIQVVTAALRDKETTDWTDGEKEIAGISGRLEQRVKYFSGLPLTIIPHYVADAEEEKWQTPWDLGLSVINGEGGISDLLALMGDFVGAYRRGDQVVFNTALQKFNLLVLEKAADHVRPRAISAEVYYNKMGPFFKAEFYYGFAVLLILLSFIVWRKWLYWGAFALLAVGFIYNLVGTVMRMYIMERPPVTNLYETFTFTALIAVLLGIILEFSDKKDLGIFGGGLTGFVMLLISGKYALEGDTMGMLVAVLDSNFWLASHVVTIILGYAGILLSGFLGHVYVIQRIIRPTKQDVYKNTFQALYAIQAFGIIFTFLGTVLGGIWADQSWGRFWGWDPKENGALLICLWSALIFHARLAKWFKDIGFALGTIIGNVCVALAWFGVNLLGVGLHSYGFTSGIASTLFIFVAFEMLFVSFGGWLLKSGKRLEMDDAGNV